MSSIPTNPFVVQGAWRLGWTLDVHTTSSEFLGYDPNGHPLFDTIRSPLGELLYQLKYRGQPTAGRIATVMAGFFDNKPKALARIDLVIPMPPSAPARPSRSPQSARNSPGSSRSDSLPTRSERLRDTPGLKDVHDPELRRDLLDGAFEADPSRVKGRGILLVDDLYRSGATANAVAVALIRAGASRVYLLAVTRTRSNV